jgi:hypothetical protein
MTRLVVCLSIVGNLATVIFLGFLIHDQEGTLRWVHDLNPFWFFLGAIALVAVFALVAVASDLYGKAKSARAGTPGEVQAAGTG